MRKQIEDLITRASASMAGVGTQSAEISRLKAKISRIDAEARVIHQVEMSIQGYLLHTPAGRNSYDRTERVDTAALRRVLLYVAGRHNVDLDPNASFSTVDPQPTWPNTVTINEDEYEDLKLLRSDPTKVINVNLGDTIEVKPDA